MYSFNKTFFQVPDLEYHKSMILSVRGTKDARKTALDQLGKDRLSLLYDPNAGIWRTKKFDRQYIIIPKSMSETYGSAYISDMAKELDRSSHGNNRYCPEQISYNDDVPKKVYRIGREIINAVDSEIRASGYGLVIIPHIKSGRAREEEKLAHLVMQELRKRDIYVSVAHTTIPSESYELRKNQEGEDEWVIKSDDSIRKRFHGYLPNLVLNKILLLNRHYWK